MVFAYQEVDPSEERLDHRPRRAQLPSEQPLRREPLRIDDSNLLESLTPVPDQLGGGASLPVSPSGNATGFRFRLLRADELKLTEQYRALGRIPAYRPLLHGGWVQQGLPEDQARPFDLALLGALNPTGSIRLHLSRFLHLRVDLSYQSNSRRPLAAQPGFDTRELTELELPPRYAMIAERQTRSGELHYFDHPAFGLLVMVRPVPAEATPLAPGGSKPAA